MKEYIRSYIKVLSFLSLFIIVFLVYSNTFLGDWHLDDFDNIVNNKNIHLKSLTWSEIEKPFHGIIKTGGGISRPFAYLSFALNYYFDGLNVLGYHLVNIFIHFLSAFFLFLFTLNTLKLPIFSMRYEKSAYKIALLSSLLWATSPLHVTAVTYIVQRMASMAGMFYIMAMYFYLKGRIAKHLKQTIFFLIISGFCSLLAFGTKENTVMLPVTFLIFDLFLIQGISKENLKKTCIILALPALVLLIATLSILDFAKIAGDYQIRPFTMQERLLTEPRVIFLYLSLLLYPAPSRLMLYHDINWSTSFLEPWTTLVSIVALLIIGASALIASRKQQLLSFCIIFFLLNHFIEGSFANLELIFEHRNYIPSMFFFLPIAVAIFTVFDKASPGRLWRSAICGVVVIFLAFQVYSTCTRNTVFETRIRLLTDNIAKTPNLSVVHHNLGVEYYNKGLYDQAVDEYNKALKINRYMNTTQRGLSYYNLGLYYQYVKKDLDQAKSFYDKGQKY